MTDDGNPPAGVPARSRARQKPSAAELGELLRALGEEQHPLHRSSVTKLVAMGRAVVPEVARTVSAKRPWLAVYQALDALIELGDGRASGAYLRALQHPNANVRWNAVRGLGRSNDLRALFALRRTSRKDDGRTSWGESVSTLARVQYEAFVRRPLIYWGRELVLTLLALLVMLSALSLFRNLLADVGVELQVFGRQEAGIEVPTLTLPTATPRPTRTATALPTVTATAAVPAAVLTGTMNQTANVRPQPGTDNQPIGQVGGGEQVRLLARNADSQWLLIQLSETPAAGSRIGTADGSGWVSRNLVTAEVQRVEALPVQTP